MFDGTLKMTRLDKLTRLYELAIRATGDQDDFCLCLHHDARTDADLVASGLPQSPMVSLAFNFAKRTQEWLETDTTDETPLFKGALWHGRRVQPLRVCDDVAVIFGGFSIETKCEYLQLLIAHERQRLSKVASHAEAVA